MRRFLPLIPLLLIALVAGLVQPAPSLAQDAPAPVRAESLQSLPVLEFGRVKPFETYASSLLLRFSGKRRIDDYSASAFALQLLLDMEPLRDLRVFLINHPDIPRALDIEPQKRRRYSFAELSEKLPELRRFATQAAALEDEQRSLVDKEWMRAYENLVYFVDLSRSWSFVKPDERFSVANADLAQRLDFKTDTPYSFLEVAQAAKALHPLTDPLENKNPQDWTETEQAAFQLMGELYQWSQMHAQTPFRFIGPPEPGQEIWLTGWEAINSAFHYESIRRELDQVRLLYSAYQNGNAEQFDQAASALVASSTTRNAHIREVRQLDWELTYNRIRPFFVSKLLYGLLFTWLLFALVSQRQRLLGLAWAGFAAVLLLHAYGLVARIVILSRPPVSNLYETFIFVSFISVLLGLLVERLNRQGIGLLAAALAGLSLLMVAGKFAAEGDTLKVLVAVLNSNFWLSTHVLTITTGYAGCLIASLLAHVYLWQALVQRKEQSVLQGTYQAVRLALLFGLLFSTLGTALGGVWADQSWGRFWGWDPKENGALMIVLWSALIFHLRLSGIVREVGFAVGCVLGGIVVMWAWFGVNLLEVGLHSYGFMSGVATNLYVFMAVELLYVGGLWIWSRMRAVTRGK